MAEGVDNNKDSSSENNRRYYDEYNGLDATKVKLVAGRFEEIANQGENGYERLAVMYMMMQKRVIDLTKRKAVAEKRFEIVQNLAYEDEVSGFPNKRGYEEFIKKLKDLDIDTSITVVFVDMDNLKKINDDPTKGHKWGDDGIIRVGQALNMAIRKTDFLFNNGGDEYCLILLDTDAEKAIAVMDRAYSKLDELNENAKSNTKFKVDHSFTYGIQTVDKDKPLDVAIEEALEKADNKMQEKKEERRKLYEK